MLIIQFLILTAIVSGVLIFFLKKILFDSTQGAVNRLNSETEEVRKKQQELNEKIKQANEELEKRRKEADALVRKMTEQAEEAAKQEREKLVNKARAEGEEIISKAQRTKDEIRKVIQQEVEIKMVEFAGQILAEVLSQKAIGALDQQLLAEFIQELKNVNTDIIDPKINTADIITARSIDNSIRNQLSDVLKEKLNRVINVNVSEDSTLIAGAVLKFGSLSLDGSLKNLVNETSLQMREKIEKS